MADDASRSATWHGEIDSVVEEESEREERIKQAGTRAGSTTFGALGENFK